ncbi:hypothetical protein I545_3746 [Mycobacterium kansasii 662]|uniref:Uncharacterized protein n=2 Tax=Mycobacterium kansasii TaxID=1768 RepID=A0A1V3XFQ2_MYCKA|nr:hypothetical protein I545_3746 [Mycobacterium kansasii 662]OOK77271.1 hypothetical protein BZL29_3732 [Mycobacterium kansasii]
MVGAAAAAFWELKAEPIPSNVLAATASAAGCVVTNDT